MENFDKPYYKLNNGYIVSKKDLTLEHLPYIVSNLYIQPMETLVVPANTIEGNLIIKLAEKINEIINVINEKL